MLSLVLYIIQNLPVLCDPETNKHIKVLMVIQTFITYERDQVDIKISAKHHKKDIGIA